MPLSFLLYFNPPETRLKVFVSSSLFCSSKNSSNFLTKSFLKKAVHVPAVILFKLVVLRNFLVTASLNSIPYSAAIKPWA